MSLETSVEILPFKDRMLIASILVALLHGVFGGFPIDYMISLPFNGKSEVGRFALAAKEVAEDDVFIFNLIPPNFPLSAIVVEDPCTPEETVGRFWQSWYNSTRDGTLPSNTKPDDFVLFAVGGACSLSCRPLVNQLGKFSVPFFSLGCMTADLSDKDNDVGHLTSASVIGNWKIVLSGLAKFIEAMKWKRIGFIADQSDSNWLQFQETLKNTLLSRNLDMKFESQLISIPVSVTISTKAVDSAQAVLKRFKGKAMVIVLLMYDTGVLATLLAANRLDMLTDYVYIAISYNPDLGSKRWPNLTELEYAQQGLVSLNFVKPERTSWERFKRRVADAVPRIRDELKSNGDKLVTAQEAGDRLPLAAGLLYDAIMLWARAAKDADVFAQVDPFDMTLSIEDRMRIVRRLSGQRFQGASGEVVTDFMGERKMTLVVDILQDEKFVSLGTFNYQSNVFDLRPDQLEKTIWPGGKRGIPPGYPEPCGYDGELCSDCPAPLFENFDVVCIPFVLAAAIGLVSLLPVYFCYYKGCAERPRDVVASVPAEGEQRLYLREEAPDGQLLIRNIGGIIEILRGPEERPDPQ